MKSFYSILLSGLCTGLFSQPAKVDPYFVRSFDTVSKYGPHCITRFIHEDRHGNMWLATWQGIMKYDGKLFTNYTLKERLAPIHVYSIYEDRLHNLWFGTVRGGVYRYNGHDFTLLTSYDGLADDIINCTMEDKQGNIWFGTDSGVSRLDTGAARLTKAKANFIERTGLPLTTKKGVTTFTTYDGLCNDRVNSIIQDKTGKIWVATRGGISCFNGKTFTEFKVRPGVPFTNVRCIIQDRNGIIWIGGQEGLYRFDPVIGELSLTQLMTNFIGYIYEDQGGNIWVNAGEKKGMALYKYDHKTFMKVAEKNAESDSQVFEMTEDRHGNIWFGTMNGPWKYDGKTISNFF